MMQTTDFKLIPKEPEEIDKKLSERSQQILEENMHKKREVLFQVGILENGDFEYLLNAEEHFKLRALTSFLESYVDYLKSAYLELDDREEEN